MNSELIYDYMYPCTLPTITVHVNQKLYIIMFKVYELFIIYVECIKGKLYSTYTASTVGMDMSPDFRMQFIYSMIN